MAPKKTATPTRKAAAAAAPAHASYQDMIKDAILNLKDRTGSSRQAIKKYIQANNELPKSMSDAAFSSHISRALQSGEDDGTFTRPKGPSGPVKLAKKTDATKTEDKPAKKEAKPAAAKKETKPKTTAVTTTKAKSTASKPAAAKKAAPKKTAVRAAPKKASTKANTAKPRKQKTPTSAPAVIEEKPVVLGKTKSGRVTKSRNPGAAAPATKAGAKKTSGAAAKKATPKKSTTPKKKEEKKEESAAA
ncbi:MAG: hypothetical protein M1822_004178 [Bathelium mastoideum]|nr:MAG: hypothetical protein M1822_004178 [Bathelium mastoideum]